MATETPFVETGNHEENNINELNSHNNTFKKIPSNTSAQQSLAPTRKRINSITASISNTDELHQIKELLRDISQDVVELKENVQYLHDQMHHQAGSQLNIAESDSSPKPILKKVTFTETTNTIDELITFKMECRNRIYDVIYNSRGQKTVVSPAHVDENRIIKLSVREKARIYIPGNPQPLQVIGEIATAIFKMGTSIFTIETALHRERNIPVVLGKEFGKQFIVGVNTEHKILTLKDDNGVPCATTYQVYLEP